MTTGMPITFYCPRCNKMLKAPEAAAGKSSQDFQRRRGFVELVLARLQIRIATDSARRKQ